jgi:hypothetical protein
MRVLLEFSKDFLSDFSMFYMLLRSWLVRISLFWWSSLTVYSISWDCYLRAES